VSTIAGIPTQSGNLITQRDRWALLAHAEAKAFRKKARILAIRMTEPFTVQTDRGPMTGVPGDWLVTNHPDDDPGSDMWSISDERMRNTYEEATDG
jgi:hypothetical protein